MTVTRNAHDLPNLDEVKACVRPLHAQVNDPDYPIIGGGTCFLVRFRGDVWLVTAKHCLRDKKDAPLRVVRQLKVGADAWTDFALFRARTGEAVEDAIDLDRTGVAELTDAKRGDWVRMYGFPKCLDNQIDHENGHIGVETFGVDGRYVGPTGSRLLHRVEFETLGRVVHLDGVSGSPVFLVPQGGDEFYFAGVVVRGSAELRTVQFVDGAAIANVLRARYGEIR